MQRAHNKIITRKAANANVLSSPESNRIGPKESALFGRKVQRKERLREENRESGKSEDAAEKPRAQSSQLLENQPAGLVCRATQTVTDIPKIPEKYFTEFKYTKIHS